MILLVILIPQRRPSDPIVSPDVSSGLKPRFRRGCSSSESPDIPSSHYDHLNMLNKSESICEMVKTGAPMDDIYREMDKCQLLCISCHKIVTKMEHLCGFVRLKKQIGGYRREKTGVLGDLLAFHDAYLPVYYESESSSSSWFCSCSRSICFT